MIRALYSAASGMTAQQLNVDNIANNLANANTAGYKMRRAQFQDLLYEHVRRIGAQASDQGTILPVGIDIGGGVKTVGTPRSMSQGTLAQTGNDLLHADWCRCAESRSPVTSFKFLYQLL